MRRHIDAPAPGEVTMNAIPTTLKPRPLAALLASGTLLLVMTACNRNKSDVDDTNPAATTPPAASTTPADNTGMPTDTGTMPSPATTAPPPDMTPPEPAEVTSGPITDAQFYTQAMTGDQNEIATGRMVASTSTNADVKQLANKIAGDHESFDKKVQDAAGSAAAVPTGTVNPDVQGKTGNDLDKAYADAMVADHQKDITMFENASKNASSATARKLATDALPVLRDHLKRAQALQSKLASG
jgi:putative membrane protein